MIRLIKQTFEPISHFGILSFLVSVVCLITFGCQSKQAETKEVAKTKTEIPQKSTNIKKDNTKKILFFGDSLTAGYQLDEADAFPSLIQDTIDALGLDYEVINAGLSGETTSGGVNRIDWVLNQEIDVFVLELGANDALRGLDADLSKQNLAKILDQVKSTYPQAKLIIAGMMAPPNLGEEYASKFNPIFAQLANEYSAGLIPFLLDGVAAIPELNLPDGKHPNANGQKIVRDNVWKVLQDFL